MTSITDAFRGLTSELKHALAEEKAPLRLGLAGLKLAYDRVGIEFLTLDEIVEGLEAAGIALKRRALQGAFARAGPRVTKREFAGTIKYKIMIRGIKDLEKLLPEGNIRVLYVEGDQPRTDRKRLAQVLSTLNGTVRVLDPYYGEESLDALEMIKNDCQVEFLSGRTQEDPGKLGRAIARFKRERPKTQIRLYPNPGELHDRYVLSEESLLLVGHGLKDIGKKESFVMVIRKSLAPDLLGSVRAAFDERWGRARPL